ncbi:MAG TPA: glycosyltransferase family 2 protein [Verrucomicrobiae bacterium]|nr:glycosyltransferase family 2 protein [Verrucomicrobiae bacterium]
MNRVVVVIPSWNGAAELPSAIESILSQSLTDFTLVIVDNASSDDSPQIIKEFAQKDKRIKAIYNDKNYGFTGGVNAGLAYAIKHKATYAALFNNDAVADKDWLKHLVAFLDDHPAYGMAACKLLHADGKTFDSTGDQYSIWGLPYPRGRDEPTSTKYDHSTEIFGASGGASIYRIAMLEKIGLFDEDIFAYYEDIDISFRAQLAGWKVAYVPEAIVYHEQGTTSAKLKDFTVYQAFKNFPIVAVRNIPKGLGRTIWPRFLLAYAAFFASAIKRGKGLAALKGIGKFLTLLPKKLRERRQIQASRTVSLDYIDSLLLHDLPPDQKKLLALRAKWWKLRGRA